MVVIVPNNSAVCKSLIRSCFLESLSDPIARTALIKIGSSSGIVAKAKLNPAKMDSFQFLFLK